MSQNLASLQYPTYYYLKGNCETGTVQHKLDAPLPPLVGDIYRVHCQVGCLQCRQKVTDSLYETLNTTKIATTLIPQPPGQAAHE